MTPAASSALSARAEASLVIFASKSSGNFLLSVRGVSPAEGHPPTAGRTRTQAGGSGFLGIVMALPRSDPSRLPTNRPLQILISQETELPAVPTNDAGGGNFLASSPLLQRGIGHRGRHPSPGVTTMRHLWLVALATLALAACGAPSADNFAKKAAMSDLYEIQAGKIATQKGQSDAVKQFGQQMVDAHSQTTAELKGIVQSKNLKIDLPTELDSKHQKMIDDLNSASAADFDKTYAKQQVDGHQEAADLFQKYADKGDDADLKQFAQKTLPVIQHHLEEAKKLPQ